MKALEHAQAPAASQDLIESLLADAARFFQTYLWESDSCRSARETLAEAGLAPDALRDFGVGYAPIGPYDLTDHLYRIGYSTADVVAAGLATRSVRGRAHAHFRSRILFPVRDRGGRVLGFAGLGTHLGPSWALWVTSPDTGLYERSSAVFGLDRAAPAIAESGTARVRPDCLEVIRDHQRGRTNAVTVHTSRITREQVAELAEVAGGADALELDVPEGMRLEREQERAARTGAPGPIRRREGSAGAEPAADRPRGLNLKRSALVAATVLTAVNVWTGAPLLAVWIGSQTQSERLLSMWGVVTVLVVLSVLAFLLGWLLTWLNAKYDQLIGRPPALARTSPWHRNMRGELDAQVRSRYGLNATEKAVAVCVVAALLAFEIWFFFFAGSSLPSN